MAETKGSATEAPASKATSLHRRRFLKGMAVAGGATIAAPHPAPAQTPDKPNANAATPNAATQAKERERPPEVDRLTTEKTGSDFMVDVCKTLDLDYMASCPGSTFRALQESFINYGANKKPEWLTCLHEEVSVGMAHGYAKVAGKPMAAIVHGTVGTQHAAMAIYNAYCDRVPVIVFTGNAGALDERRPGVEWFHSVQDGAATVRDFVKWDDYPMSLQHFAESTVRGYALSCAQPPGPVFIVADTKLQEDPLGEREARKLKIPRLTSPSQAIGDANALREAARMLVSAETPVIIADRYARSQGAMDNLVRLAELLQAPVIDNRSRMNMPNTHYLCQSERAGVLIAQADCILSLEPVDLYGQLNTMRDQLERVSVPKVKGGVKVISISTHDLLVRANYQDFQRYVGADINMTADAQTTLPFLIEAVQREISGSRNASEMRGEKLRQAYSGAFERARAEAALAWDATPISTARLYMELWALLQKEDWALVADGDFSSRWPHRLWPLEKHYRFIGGSGAYGVGYQPVAALGAALAHRDAGGGRVVINVCGDGEFNMAPHTLWTAAHHGIPYLTIIQNNRAYHQEIMHVQRMANRHNRDIRTASIGTTIDNPNIDYAKIAQAYGAVGIGPIEDPNDLADAFRRGIAAVKQGRPALIDVITQPR